MISAYEGPGSLREAILAAETAPDPDTIVFAPALRNAAVEVRGSAGTAGSDSSAGASALRISTPITIEGSGQVLSGSPRFATITPTGDLTVMNLTLSGFGTTGGTGGGGGAGLGGVFYNQGDLQVFGVTFRDNSAFGGPGTRKGGGGGLTTTDGAYADPAGGGPNGGAAAGPDTPAGDGGFGGGGGGGVTGETYSPMLGQPGGKGGFGGGGTGADARAYADYSSIRRTSGRGGDGGFGGGGGPTGSMELFTIGGVDYSDLPGAGGAGGFGGGAGGGATAVPARGPWGSGGGGAGMGGAVFNQGGTVTVVNTTFIGNAARGGSASDTTVSSQAYRGGAGGGYGGAVFNLNGTVTFVGATASGNTVAAGAGNPAVPSGGTGGPDVYNLSLDAGPGVPAAPARVFAVPDFRGQPLPTPPVEPAPGGGTGWQTLDVPFGSLGFTPRAPLDAGRVGTPYSAQLGVEGGGWLFWVDSGLLPLGLTLSPDGVLSGTPTNIGVYTLLIGAVGMGLKAEPGNGTQFVRGLVQGTRQFTVIVGPRGTDVRVDGPLTGFTGGPFGPTAFTAVVDPAVPGTTFPLAVTGGALPPGLALGADGRLTGTPTATGTYPFTVEFSPTCRSCGGSGTSPSPSGRPRPPGSGWSTPVSRTARWAYSSRRSRTPRTSTRRSRSPSPNRSTSRRAPCRRG